MTDKGGKIPNQLNEIYGGLQSQLRAGLISSRHVIDHPGTIGDGTEANWLKMLQDHLPHRYQAEKAFVVDGQGQQSEQIDIVIYDRQYTPELFNGAAQKVIPAEGVYAVLEVKQTFDKGNVEYAGGKVFSVRRLTRTSAPIIHAGGQYEPRPPSPIVGGILTTESGWNPPFGTPFETSLSSRASDERLDIGCVIDAGGFEAIYCEHGLQTRTSQQEHALAFFFMRLLHRLQRIGTVPAIDYEVYLNAFEWQG